MTTHPIRQTIQLIEESLALLRQLAPRTFLRYLLLGVPWTFLLWIFFFQIRHDGHAVTLALPSAALSALAYLLYRSGCLLFCRDLYRQLAGTPPPSGRALLQRQLTLHGWLLLPLFPALCFPPLLPPLLFLQGALSAARTPDTRTTLKTLLVQEIRQATWLFALLLPALILLILNLSVLFGILPNLLLSLGGWRILPGEGKITVSGIFLIVLLAIQLFNTLFLACLCHIRFRVESAQTGEACRLALVRSGLLKCLLPLLLIASAGLADVSADPQHVQQDIRIILRERRYNWQASPENNNFEHPTKAPIQTLQALGNTLCDAGDWINRNIVNRLTQFLPKFRNKRHTTGTPGAPLQAEDWLFFGLSAAVILTAAWAIWLVVRHRLRPPISKPMVLQATSLPNLNATDLQPGQLPLDGWQELAWQMMQQERWKLACRAWFMAQICSLAQRRLLHLATSKSNRDYLRELRNRGTPALPFQPDFQASQQEFDALWYGGREANAEMTYQFQERCHRSAT